MNFLFLIIDNKTNLFYHLKNNFDKTFSLPAVLTPFPYSRFSNSRRPRKSPEVSGDSNSERPQRSYDERSRDSERYRGSERERETRNRH